LSGRHADVRWKRYVVPSRSGLGVVKAADLTPKR